MISMKKNPSESLAYSFRKNLLTSSDLYKICRIYNVDALVCNGWNGASIMEAFNEIYPPVRNRHSQLLSGQSARSNLEWRTRRVEWLHWNQWTKALWSLVQHTGLLFKNKTEKIIPMQKQFCIFGWKVSDLLPRISEGFASRELLSGHFSSVLGETSKFDDQSKSWLSR